jgi:NADPH:quinone reductase-like Zn-dependent oxidoreductase
MRAIVHERYGPPEVLHLEEVPVPTPKADEVRVRIRATTVNRTDCGFRSGTPRIVRPFSGLFRPRRKILGTEFAGVVDAIGSAVTELAVGDEVFGVNADRFGAHAEYLCMRERDPIAPKPVGVTDEEAAAVCDGVVLALMCLRKADVRAGQRLLVYGASGSIGTAAVQLAKHLGAHVTAVCNTPNLEIVRSLGADDVIDYTAEDFAARDESYDAVLDAVGKISLARCRPVLARGGCYIATEFGPRLQNPFLALRPARLTRHRVLFPLPRYKKAEVLFVKQLMEAGKYRAVIDRCYPLEEVVEATRYVETEQKTGNVVLVVD